MTGFPAAASVTLDDPRRLAPGGEATIDPLNADYNGDSSATQRLMLSMFTAIRTETINNLATITGNTAAAPTPTLCRMGVYQVDTSDNGTLIAATANDTTLFAAANTYYERATTAPWVKIAGQRYAFASLVVSAVAGPTIMATRVFVGQIAFNTSPPIRAAQVAGQADLPASYTSAQLIHSGDVFYGETRP